MLHRNLCDTEGIRRNDSLAIDASFSKAELYFHLFSEFGGDVTKIESLQCMATPSLRRASTTRVLTGTQVFPRGQVLRSDYHQFLSQSDLETQTSLLEASNVNFSAMFYHSLLLIIKVLS